MMCKKCIEEMKKLKKELRKYKTLSMIDDLTGIYNHRKLQKDIVRYLDIKKRYNINFTLMMLDIDKFKAINDNYGHKQGDKILKATAKVLKQSIRKYEKVYRTYNGDEFVIIFSHTKNIDLAVKRIKKNLAKIKVEISIGYYPLCNKAIREAELKMYEDKEGKK